MPPYPHDFTASASNAVLGVDAVESETLASAWLAWVAGLTGQDRATIAFAETDLTAPWVLPLRPISVDLNTQSTAHEVIGAVFDARQQAADYAPIAADCLCDRALISVTRIRHDQCFRSW